jgi:hypothetical protein
MSTALMEPVELRARGFESLVQSLGWVNAVRLIQQYEPSRHNYVLERDAILPNWNAAELVQQMKQAEATKPPADKDK